MSLNIPNLDRLISHLEGLPEEKFDMQAFYSRHGESEFPINIRGTVGHSCGTAACIAGWIFEIDVACLLGISSAGLWLGLTQDEAYLLFGPDGYQVSAAFPLSRAIRTLRHMHSEYLRTGQVVVDWDAPEPVTKAAWSAPCATERKLPAEIISPLRSAQHSEVSA